MRALRLKVLLTSLAFPQHRDGHNGFTGNGEQCVNCLSQPRGQPQRPGSPVLRDALQRYHAQDVSRPCRADGRGEPPAELPPLAPELPNLVSGDPPISPAR